MNRIRIHSPLSRWRPVMVRRSTHIQGPVLTATRTDRARLAVMIVVVGVLGVADAILLMSAVSWLVAS